MDDLLLLLLGGLFTAGVYAALIWGLARVLPARTYPLLRALHWGTSVLALLLVSVPLVTGWSFRSVGLLLLSLLLLSSGLLAGIRGRLRLGRAAGLSTVQAVLLFPGTPLLLLVFSLASPSADVAYEDDDFVVTVAVETHFSMQVDDEKYVAIKLYRKRAGVFQEHLGNSTPPAVSLNDDTVPQLMRWWQGVSALYFEPNSNRLVARNNGKDSFVLFTEPFPLSNRPPEQVREEFTPPEPSTVKLSSAKHGTARFIPPVAKKEAPEDEDGPEAKDKFVATVTVRGNPDTPDLTELSGEGTEVVEEVVSNKAYTYVEQMPELPGGGGNAAIVAAIQQAIEYAPRARRHQFEGRIFVSFVVNQEGRVSDVKVEKGLNPHADSAVLAAVRQLPRLLPGRQNRRLVNVQLTLPITITKPTGHRAPAGRRKGTAAPRRMREA